MNGQVAHFPLDAVAEFLGLEHGPLQGNAHIAQGAHAGFIVQVLLPVFRRIAGLQLEHGERKHIRGPVDLAAGQIHRVDALLETCGKYAQESPFLFDEDLTTDQPERQVMAEIIREKILWNLEKEIPHGTAVEITRFTERDSGVIDIDATIYCEKASHKGIIIGKQGAMLKKISTQARHDCEKFMGTKVYLTTWVKVKENWRDSDFLVRNFGYNDN